MTWPMAHSWEIMRQGTYQVHRIPKARALNLCSTASQVSHGQGATKVWTMWHISEIRHLSSGPGLPSASPHPHPRPSPGPLGCGHSLGQKHRVYVSQRNRDHIQNTPLHTHTKEATPAASSDAWEAVTQRSFPGRRVWVRRSPMITARTKAKAVCGVREPRPRSRSIPTSLDEVAWIPGTEPQRVP